MNTVSVKVASSTKTSNDNYCNKLQAAGAMIKTPLGDVEGASRTFYLFTTAKNEEGKEVELNLDLFDIVAKDFPFNDDEGNEQVATLNYLYPKRA